jgi:glucosamine--fructose-6-phosphate aminotransferase (isomerizing)
MCGIFGYKGDKDCSKMIVEGLKSLEYRGYDSWGIALKTDNGVFLKKEIGQISEAKELEGVHAKIGIGHTRWATHGKVDRVNSHPHHDNEEKYFVVHNGIVENYNELKKELLGEFYSQTDTEVIPKLIAKFADEGFESAVKRTACLLQGNFAFVVIEKGSDKVIAARKGSPLVIGKGKNEFFISSDIQAFIKYTKEVYFMNEGEIAIIDKGLKFYNFIEKEDIEKESVHVDMDETRAMKAGFKHFMLKEIFEQPDVIIETLNGYSTKENTVFPDLDKICEINRIIITACGTSWHAALASEYWFESIARIPVEVEYASEFRYRDPLIEKGTVVLAISQSGETADTIAAIKEAQAKGAKVISICNVVGSTISRISDVTLYTRAGPEIGVASTKAFTTQLSILFLMALHVGAKKGIVNDERVKEMIDAIRDVPGKIKKILHRQNEIKRIADSYYEKHNALFLGRGVNYPIALEGALKLKEISYIHSEGYPAAEMKHGPIALVDNEMPSIFICVKDKSYEKVISNINEVRARKGIVIALATEDDSEIYKITDETLYLPKIRDELTPFITVVPLQLLAYFIADRRNCEIDKPRNLAKSVTVE